MAAAETPNLPTGAEVAGPDRRALLRGMSAMGLAAFTVPLALQSGATAATAEPQPKDPPPKKKGGKKKKKGGAAEGKLVKASDTPLGSTEDIPVNGGMLFESDEYIVTQPKAGKFVGFDALCTHEGCPVDVFEPGTMNCSCHGASFSNVDGKVKGGPARKPLPKKAIIVEGGQIYKAKPA